MSKIFEKKEFKIKPFEFEGIELKECFLKNQYKKMRDLYLNIPNDDLLKGFRKRAKSTNSR